VTRRREVFKKENEGQNPGKVHPKQKKKLVLVVRPLITNEIDEEREKIKIPNPFFRVSV
ncbi:hypothetical protein RUM43_008560, partial [Polyplax serrata]